MNILDTKLSAFSYDDFEYILRALDHFEGSFCSDPSRFDRLSAIFTNAQCMRFQVGDDYE